jgi:hypothetical protein
MKISVKTFKMALQLAYGAENWTEDYRLFPDEYLWKKWRKFRKE